MLHSPLVPYDLNNGDLMVYGNRGVIYSTSGLNFTELDPDPKKISGLVKLIIVTLFLREPGSPQKLFFKKKSQEKPTALFLHSLSTRTLQIQSHSFSLFLVRFIGSELEGSVLAANRQKKRMTLVVSERVIQFTEVNLSIQIRSLQ